MPSKKGTCLSCGKERSLPANDRCWKCNGYNYSGKDASARKPKEKKDSAILEKGEIVIPPMEEAIQSMPGDAAPEPPAAVQYFNSVRGIPRWKDIKKKGSGHYKGGDVEPIDLYVSLGILPDFASASSIKYAARLKQKGLNVSDLDKIIHYAEMLKSAYCDVLPGFPGGESPA